LNFEDLKKIEVFNGLNFSQLFEIIFNNSLEERRKAIETFDEFKDKIHDLEEIFISGDKPKMYLEIAQGSTENLIKLITAANKFVENKETESDSFNSNDFIDYLDNQGIGPKRFLLMKNNKQEIDESEENVKVESVEKDQEEQEQVTDDENYFEEVRLAQI